MLPAMVSVPAPWILPWNCVEPPLVGQVATIEIDVAEAAD
jgi:hypothetical protein